MVVVDAMEKAAGVRVLQAELNDQPGVSVKLAGSLGDVRAAAEAAREIAARMQTQFVLDVIPRPDREALRAIEVAPDYQAILGQPMVQVARPWENGKKEKQVGRDAGFAVGLIETQGFTAVFEAIDTAVKTAAVEVLAREKLGGGYITVVIKGDVAAVTAAVDAGKAKVDGLGKLIAAYVIPNPSQAVLSLLPEL